MDSLAVIIIIAILLAWQGRATSNAGRQEDDRKVPWLRPPQGGYSGPPPIPPGPFLNSVTPGPSSGPPSGVPSRLLPPRPRLSAGNAKKLEDVEYDRPGEQPEHPTNVGVA